MTRSSDAVRESDSDQWDGLEEDPFEFRVSGPAKGWTVKEDFILEAALDLAGITDPAEREIARMSVGTVGILNLAPLVKQAEMYQAAIRGMLDSLRGGIGK